ncbi:MAG: carboxymuconolactone decarboxylase family protein [Proteobacteria bacterium]|nr:carboxymuconolactone decarboxylase family protein [Burkholderiales bacterium]
MSDTTGETPADVSKRLTESRGYSYPEWEYLAERDPEFLEAYNRLSGLGLLHDGVSSEEGKALPAKYRELVAIAAMIGQSRMWGVKAHMERALRVGCSEREILEALEAALIPVGSPPFRQAVNILMQVVGWKPASER